MNVKILVVLAIAVMVLASMSALSQQIQQKGNSRPLEVTGPPYDGQYRETSAQLPANHVMDWWGRVEGGFVSWPGRYEVCFDFIIYGAGPNGEDLITSSPCGPCPDVIFTPAPTRTPTATYTPTITPTPTKTPTIIQ